MFCFQWSSGYFWSPFYTLSTNQIKQANPIYSRTNLNLYLTMHIKIRPVLLEQSWSVICFLLIQFCFLCTLLKNVFITEKCYKKRTGFQIFKYLLCALSCLANSQILCSMPGKYLGSKSCTDCLYQPGIIEVSWMMMLGH